MITTRDRKMHIADLLDLSQLSGIDLQLTIDLEKLLRRNDSLVLGGFEEGTNQYDDLITETKDGFPLAGMWQEFQDTIRLWNSQRDALMNLLTYRVTSLIEGVRYPIEQDFEEASEFGVPKGIRLGPSIRHGYPFKWYDLAIRYTWQYLTEVTAAELRALNNTAMEADNRLMFSRVMRRLFSNVTATADIDGDAVNVYGFYNGDTQVPPKWKTTTFAANHNHYLESGGTTVDSGDLDTLIGHITHHGYTQLGGYTIVVLVNEQEADVIRTFNVADGDKFTFIPSNAPLGGRILDANGGIVGAPSMATFPGLVTIGSYGSAVIVQEEYVPAGYMVCFATGGQDNLGNPIGIREHEQASLQGLKLVKGPQPNYPLIDSYYIHGLGCGVRHRGAGAVMEIGNGGTYTIPAAYA